MKINFFWILTIGWSIDLLNKIVTQEWYKKATGLNYEICTFWIKFCVAGLQVLVGKATWKEVLNAFFSKYNSDVCNRSRYIKGE